MYVEEMKKRTFDRPLSPLTSLYTWPNALDPHHLLQNVAIKLIQEEEKRRVKNDHHAFPTTSSFCNTASIAPEKNEKSRLQKVTIGNTISGLSPSSKYSGDKDGFLLPELNECVNEFDLAATKAGISPRKDKATPRSDVEMPRASVSAEGDDYEQEIKNLRNMVQNS
ncbi:hypothetical protein F0562_022881 [Nyssa sinensis]|uniref:Uncharacterized protein n=1 Tax=Nyssa sinensis TaxID=561372 RepID=A0A5J5BG56_9ASTE|nr:hypothetical protein F0562_022881 [Nyssa sinensis]